MNYRPHNGAYAMPLNLRPQMPPQSSTPPPPPPAQPAQQHADYTGTQFYYGGHHRGGAGGNYRGQYDRRHHSYGGGKYSTSSPTGYCGNYAAHKYGSSNFNNSSHGNYNNSNFNTNFNNNFNNYGSTNYNNNNNYNNNTNNNKNDNYVNNNINNNNNSGSNYNNNNNSNNSNNSNNNLYHSTNTGFIASNSMQYYSVANQNANNIDNGKPRGGENNNNNNSMMMTQEPSRFNPSMNNVRDNSGRENMRVDNNRTPVRDNGRSNKDPRETATRNGGGARDQGPRSDRDLAAMNARDNFIYNGVTNPREHHYNNTDGGGWECGNYPAAPQQNIYAPPHNDARNHRGGAGSGDHSRGDGSSSAGGDYNESGSRYRDNISYQSRELINEGLPAINELRIQTVGVKDYQAPPRTTTFGKELATGYAKVAQNAGNEDTAAAKEQSAQEGKVQVDVVKFVNDDDKVLFIYESIACVKFG